MIILYEDYAFSEDNMFKLMETIADQRHIVSIHCVRAQTPSGQDTGIKYVVSIVCESKLHKRKTTRGVATTPFEAMCKCLKKRFKDI